MPGKNGTGPTGQGPIGGRGRGQGRGRGLGGGYSMGPGGECICSNCGFRELHEVGVPCYSKKCPKCGSLMARG